MFRKTNLTCYNCGKKLKGRQIKYCSKNCQIKFRRCYNCGKYISKARFRSQIFSILLEDQKDFLPNAIIPKRAITFENIETKTDQLLNALWFSKYVRLLCCTCLDLPHIKKSLGLI